ncbi:MAG TPA: hypothetical protein VJ801_11145 [Polyangia bacterium]|nr:hypothetical protein [Polyangia bacterium]
MASRGNRLRAQEDRKDALSSFLEARVAEGFRVESRTATQAIIVSPEGLLGRFRRAKERERQVVVVNEQGEVSMTPAQPLRS